MGIFSRVFGSSDIDKQLEYQYVPMLQMMGMSSSQAKNNFHDMLKLAKEESQAEGSSNLPQNFGDILIERESTNDKFRSMLAKRRKEGVRDEDVRWWWNMHDLERRMMLKVDEIFRLSLFKELMEEEGLGEEKAAKEVRKLFPIYGDPEDTTNTNGDDRPLPEELKDRINIYIEKRSLTDPEEYKKQIKESSTLNALIRKEIKKGII